VDEPNPRHWQKLGLAASFPTCLVFYLPTSYKAPQYMDLILIPISIKHNYKVISNPFFR
jgi:hypothetical protein